MRVGLAGAIIGVSLQGAEGASEGLVKNACGFMYAYNPKGSRTQILGFRPFSVLQKPVETKWPCLSVPYYLVPNQVADSFNSW